jgi:hypothetical protein
MSGSTEPDKELAQALDAIKAAHFDAGGTSCGYRAYAESRERGHLAACFAALESFDPKRVRIPAQTAFWVNVFNAGVLCDAPELEVASSVREVEAFFEHPRIRIGGHAFSLDDIEHGILRGNVPKHGRLRAPMDSRDARLAFMPIAFDERVHFAMYSASRSSPALRGFDAGKLDAQLEEAAADYVRRTVRVEEQGAVIVLPRLLKWYGIDFGGERGALDFVLARLDDETVDAIDRRRGRVKLRYAEFDWTLNTR